jgi:inorganic pyrophosphatase
MAVASRNCRGDKVNDNLKPDEIADLEQVAEWLDSLYVRLQGAEIAFATQTGNERFCELLQGEIERAAQIGIALNRPMENCGCLFEALSGDADPKDFLVRARSEVNAIAVAVRQMAIDEHRDANEVKTTSQEPVKTKIESISPIDSKWSDAITEFNKQTDSPAAFAKKWVSKNSRRINRMVEEHGSVKAAASRLQDAIYKATKKP